MDNPAVSKTAYHVGVFLAGVMRVEDDEDGNPLCDVWGDCEPYPEEAHRTQAMCQHCGGWRYRDWPSFGNWGQWQPDLEEKWVHLVHIC